MFNSLSGIWREDLLWLVCFPWIFVNTCPYRIVHSAWPELGSLKVETVLVDVSCKLPDNGLEQFRSLCSCKHICGTSTQCHGRKKMEGENRNVQKKKVETSLPNPRNFHTPRVCLVPFQRDVAVVHHTRCPAPVCAQHLSELWRAISGY